MDNVALKSLSQLREINAPYRFIQVAEGAHLRRARIHEVMGASADVFVVALSDRTEAGVIWIGLHRDVVSLCPTGLQDYLDPDQIIIVEAVSRSEILWAADAALRAEGAFTVIVDLPDALTLKESRRLQLAAEQGGGLGLIILRAPAAASAAQTRWVCEPLTSDRPSWDWRCVKGKNGEKGQWIVSDMEVCRAKDYVHLAASASA